MLFAIWFGVAAGAGVFDLCILGSGIFDLKVKVYGSRQGWVGDSSSLIGVNLREGAKE